MDIQGKSFIYDFFAFVDDIFILSLCDSFSTNCCISQYRIFSLKLYF